MNKIHVTVVALILGISGALGVAAATHTAGLQTTSANSGVSDAVISARAHRLDKVARDIARARRDKPPALPAVPAANGSVASTGSARRLPATGSGRRRAAQRPPRVRARSSRRATDD